MSSEPMRSGVYLRSYLAPFADLLADPAVTDVLVNQPGEIWVERLGTPMERLEAPLLTGPILTRLAQQIAAVNHQGLNREHPLLSASLPDGSRVQVVAPPATRGGVALAIRRHVVSDLGLDDYGREGAFEMLGRPALEPPRSDEALADPVGFLRRAVRERRTIVLSGGTASGKTTLLNALLKEIPRQDRVIAIEDAAEVRLDHPNALGLICARGEAGEARVTAEDLLQACLRLRPDRILLGELRGREAFAFLRAVNTGHPGSITTVHADTPRGALDQIALMVLQAGLNIGWSEVRAYVSQVVDVVVQLNRRDGLRRVSDILINPR